MRTTKTGLSRLRQMSLREIASRARQSALQRRDALFHAIGIAPVVPAIRSTSSSGRFFLTNDELLALAELIDNHYPELASTIRKRAEAICRHRFSLLGFNEIDFGSKLNWHLDVIHQKQAPLVPWHRVPYFDFEKVGDPKITWELNRHQHLVTLAQAFLIFKEQRYLDELTLEFRDWKQANPYPLGINWASSLEVGFRLLSWVWVRFLLKAAGANLLDSEIVQGVALHGAHIRRYLSTYTSPNTHLLGEAVALFVAGVTCREISASGEWTQVAWDIVLAESKRQVRDDGFHFEQSTYYHVYALDFFLHARLLAAKNGMPIPAEFDVTLLRMLGALQRLAEGGAIPKFGDDDGGRVFDGTRNRAEHLSDPLSIGAVVYPDAGLRLPNQGPTAEALWLLGSAVAPAAGGRSNQTSSPVSSGIFILHSGEHRVVVDAGPQGTGNSGHGHADALSLTASSGGVECLVDPGTFSYSTYEGRRELLRSTGAHNTVEVDGLSQADPAGPFSWRTIPETKVHYWVHEQGFAALCASHDGYQRLQKPVTHRRWVILAGTILFVRDMCHGEGRHRFASKWHFGANSRTEMIEGASSIACQLGSARTILVAPTGSTLRLTEAWQSPGYGVKVPAPSMEISSEKDAPCEMALAIALGEGNTTSIPALTESAAQSLSSFRLEIASSVHEFIFNDVPGSNWESGTMKSDAQFVHIQFAENAEPAVIHLCDASYFKFADEEMFSSEQRVTSKELLLREPRSAAR